MKPQFQKFIEKKCLHMSKQIFLLLAVTATLASCGSDDSDGGKRPSTVTLQGAGTSYTMTMSYDSKGRVDTYTSTVDGFHTSTFSYNDKGKVSNVSTTGAFTGTIAFTYGSDGKLSLVSRSGEQPVPVVWSDDHTATMAGSTFTFDTKGDLEMFGSYGFTRDSGKGSFASVKGADGLIMFIVDPITMYFASKRPLASLNITGTPLTFSNDFEGGYISNAVFTLNGDTYTLNYNY